jgi:lipopolysaccharide transport protein LptA
MKRTIVAFWRQPLFGALTAIVAMLAIFISTPSWSIANPTTIKADTISTDYLEKDVLWSGHVHLTNLAHCTCEVTSDSLRVNYESNFHDINSATAQGNVRIYQKGRWLSGQRADFDTAGRTIVLTGSRVIHEVDREIRGSRITVHLDTNQNDIR